MFKKSKTDVSALSNVYEGVIGIYTSYNTIGTIKVEQTKNGNYIGTIAIKDKGTYKINFNLLPIPPTIPPSPQLLSGTIDVYNLYGTNYPMSTFKQGTLNCPAIFPAGGVWYSMQLTL
jgi:hypothetical protein